MLKLITYLLIPFLTLNTSFEPTYKPPDYLISKISIVCTDTTQSRHEYTDQASMQQILQYLRTVEFFDAAEDPPPIDSLPVFDITLFHCTGRITTYQQISCHYLSKNGSKLHRLDPAQGQQLFALFYQ